MRSHMIVVVTLAATVVAGCAYTPPRTDLSQSGLGRVVGRESNFAERVLLRLGTRATINIRAVNGIRTEDSWSYRTAIELSPGKYKLEVGCFGYHDSLSFASVQMIEIEIEAGKEYLLVPSYPTPRTCEVSVLSDLTSPWRRTR